MAVPRHFFRLSIAFSIPFFALCAERHTRLNIESPLSESRSYELLLQDTFHARLSCTRHLISNSQVSRADSLLTHFRNLSETEKTQPHSLMELELARSLYTIETMDYELSNANRKRDSLEKLVQIYDETISAIEQLEWRE